MAVNKKNKTTQVFGVDMNNHVLPKEMSPRNYVDQFVLYGNDNKFFKYLDARYKGSTTNKSVIDKICQYLIGSGLYNNGVEVKTVLPKKELRNIIKDYKKYGQAAVEVIYDLGRKVHKMNHIPMQMVGIKNQDNFYGAPEAYFISFDWTRRFEYQPIEIPAFGLYDSLTDYEKSELRKEGFTAPAKELLVIGQLSYFPWFTEPDYCPALEACENQEEILHFTRQWIKQSFSAGYIVSLVKGLEDTPESMKAASEAVIKGLTGTEKAGGVTVIFSDNPEQKTSIEAVPANDQHKKYLETSAETHKIILEAHQFYPVLMGAEGAAGFTDKGETMRTALAELRVSTINPMREVILEALESVMKINDPNVNLEFKDFEDVMLTEEEVVAEPDGITDEQTIIE